MPITAEDLKSVPGLAEELQSADPQEGDAWRPRPVPKPQSSFGLAAAPGEDNEAYAKQYNTD